MNQNQFDNHDCGEENPQYNIDENQQYNITFESLEEKPKGFSIASLVFGICSLCFSCCVPYVTFLTSIVGMIFGVVSRRKKQDGKGMAIAGIILSIIALIFSIVTCAIYFSYIERYAVSVSYQNI